MEGQGACWAEEAPVVATKEQLFELIRRDSRLGGLSVRALAGKYGVHRRLVREALMHASRTRARRRMSVISMNVGVGVAVSVP